VFGIPVSRSGISYDPILEKIFVAQWANYKLEDFEALEGERQSLLVAAYRSHNQVEAVLAKVQNDKIKAGRKGG
jgi:hypothetical protein